MISQLLKLVVCKIKKHTLVAAGACPFTRKNYNACTRCGTVIAI